MALSIGQDIGEYQIQQRLGQGAFGTVYLAQDRHLTRLVAIKVLSLTSKRDKNTFQRFIQEARAAGNLNHPNIVTVYSLKAHEDDVYLIMEYLSNGSLRQTLEKSEQLQLKNVVKWAADVCDGLAAAHSRSIIHRDIKPENILLADTGRAKISDFGIAHVPNGANLTQAGFQPGTMIYMSPEQLRGNRVDGRSDVYQVGILLYEMLTGRHYINLSDIEQQAKSAAGSNMARYQARYLDLLDEIVCKTSITDPRQLRPDIPDWLARLIFDTLQKNVMHRPTAEQLAQELRSGLSNGQSSSANFCPQCGQAAPGGAKFCKYCGCRLSPEAVSVNVASPPVVSPQKDISADIRAQRLVDAGYDYAVDGSLDQAIEKFQAAINIAPDYTDAHYNLGLAQSMRGNLEDACAALEKAASLNRNVSEVHSSLGLVYEEMARYDEAFREYQLAIDLDGRNLPALVNMGKLHGSFGRYADAIEAFESALAIDDSDPRIHYGLAITYKSQNRYDLARHHANISCQLGFDAACQLLEDLIIPPERIDSPLGDYHPDAIYYYNLGLERSQQGLWDSAISAFQEAVRIDPNYAEAYYNAGVIYGNRGDYGNEIRQYELALRLIPDYAEAHCNLGLAYGLMGRLREAIDELELALELRPNYFEALTNLGLMYGKQGRIEDEIKAYQAALELAPQDQEIRSNLAMTYAQQGRISEAIEQYQTILKLDSTSSLALFGLARIYEKLGDLDQAIDAYRTDVRFNPNHATARFNLGILCHSKGDIDEAITQFQTGLRLTPEAANAHFILGKLYFQKKHFNDAIKEFEIALKLDPTDGDVHAWLGAVYFDQGRFDETIRHCKRALEIDPTLSTEAGIHVDLGRAYLYQSRPDEAIKEFKLAQSMDPEENEVIYYVLSVAYAKQGRFLEAKREAEAAERLGHPDAKDLLRKINEDLARRSSR